MLPQLKAKPIKPYFIILINTVFPLLLFAANLFYFYLKQKEIAFIDASGDNRMQHRNVTKSTTFLPPLPRC